ncbi:MAG: cation transporter [Chloroflexi bacterium]|nr:MAG: cation transporter [Chloroflexota bacterium]
MTADHHHAPSDEGAATRAVVVSAAVLGAAAAIEFAASASGRSAGVLADALHNAGDVLTTLVLLAAFAVARRPATRRFTSGFGRVEDVATLVIILIIVFTAAAAAFESLGRLLSSEGYSISRIGPSLLAAAIGVVANLGVSEYKIRVGRRIRSLALEADGIHSRLDALVSAGAFAGLGLAWMGIAIADPLTGLAITIAIVYILAGTVGRLVLRMMDAVDPDLIDQIASAARSVKGVLGVHDVRARWVGRELVAMMHIDCAPNASLIQAHDIAQAVQQEVELQVPAVHLDVHMDPGTGAH